jgi:hypothetical protein
LQNDSGNSIQVIQIVFYWPNTSSSDKYLSSINMSGSPIWDAGTNNSPLTISAGQWLPGTDLMREVGPYTTGIMQFYFKKAADNSPYIVTVTFDNGCTRSANR